MLLAALLLANWQAVAGSAALVTRDGIGKARFGMTLTQLNLALGETFKVPSGPDDKNCFYIEPKTLDGVSLMIEQGRLRRIDVRATTVTTGDGVGVGTPVSNLKSRYGSRLRDEQHHYGGPEDRYLTLELNSTLAIRFETSEGKVDNWYAGYKKQVQYVEGCL